MSNVKDNIDEVTRNMHICNSQIADALSKIHIAKKLLDYPILSTPTGKRREDITEANIHSMAAETALSRLFN